MVGKAVGSGQCAATWALAKGISRSRQLGKYIHTTQRLDAVLGGFHFSPNILTQIQVFITLSKYKYLLIYVFKR